MMLILIFILFWLLLNTWTTIATIMRTRHISSKDFGMIAVCTIFSYPVCKLIFEIVHDREDEVFDYPPHFQDMIETE